MLETAIALIFAHLLADFVLQTRAMVQHKHRPGMLALHVAIAVTVSWAALGFAPRPLPLAAIAISHALIDWTKLRYGRGFLGFALDQAAHLAVILAIALLAPGAWAAGLWGLPSIAPQVGWLPPATALGAGLVATVWSGGYAVQALMSHIPPPIEASLPKGGQLIGRLERLMILVLVLHGQPDGIGFLITAKSILRFGEVSRDASGDSGRRISEYVIIGTLASFAWAIVTAYATLAALAALRAP